MNINNLNLLIATIEAEILPDGNKIVFNMAEWGRKDGCGTIACIGGTAAILGGRKDENVSVFAANWLGLSYEQSNLLFIRSRPLDYCQVTPAVAVKCLTRFRDTGQIVWEL